jgi:hypothetical protein
LENFVKIFSTDKCYPEPLSLSLSQPLVPQIVEKIINDPPLASRTVISEFYIHFEREREEWTLLSQADVVLVYLYS